MFVVIKRSKTSKRELVYIVESYRDENQRIRQRIIKKCGELSELVAQDPDAIEKLKEEAKRMTRESSSKEVELSISLNQPNAKGSKLVNYGYVFVESLYNSLKIDRFLERQIDDPEEASRIGETLRYYVIREFFTPLTGRRTARSSGPLFGDFGSSTAPTLDALTPLLELQEELQKHVYKVANKGHECRDRVSSLDITSYNFNAVPPRRGAAESTPLDSMIMVQVGFLFDRYRNPSACIIFPEGRTDTPLLLKELSRLRRRYNLKKIVITSDRGFGSNSTLGALANSGNGYVVGIRVKNSTLALQEKVLDEQGYRWSESGTFKYKTFMSDRVVGESTIPEKVIALWTANNAAKMKQRRDKTIVDYLAHPQAFEQSGLPEMDKYVRVHDTNVRPDESSADHSLFSFDTESYMRDVALDGYYALATTELDIPDAVVIKRYHNLQKIGKAFAVPDPDIEGAPKDLWTFRDVQAYFLISFIEMVIETKLVRMLDDRFDIEEIKTALSEATCKNIGQDIFDISVQSDLFRQIEEAFGVKFDRAYATLEMIRRYRKDVIAAL